MPESTQPSLGVAGLLVPVGTALSAPGSPIPATPIAIPSKGGLLAPASPLARLIRVPSLSGLLRHSPSSSPTSDCTPPDWLSVGMSSLPPDPQLVLLDLGSAPDSYLGEPSPSPSFASSSSSSSSVDRLGRQIPRNVPFVREWSGALPTASSFDVSNLGPALYQAGDYHLTLAWRGEGGQMQDLAAAKSVTVAMGRKIILRGETNRLSFTKPDGPATVTVCKERWWQSTRKDRSQQYRWTLNFRPPHDIRESPAEYTTDSYFAPHEVKPGTLSIPIIQPAGLSPGRLSPYGIASSPGYSSEEEDVAESSDSEGEGAAASRARIDIKVHRAADPLPHAISHLPTHSGPA